MKSNVETAQPKWQRITLLSVLGYEAAGCLAGGSLLIAAPDGRYMDMPVDIMHGAFIDFLIPGIILFGLGIINTIAFFMVLRKDHYGWMASLVANGGLLIWFWVEIAILQAVHWLHAMWGLPVVAGFLAGFSLIPSRRLQLHRAFLVCGIVSAILYAAINVIVALQWPSYSSASQTVSELSAVEAPTRILWIVLSTPYTILSVAFAWGVWWSARDNRRLRIAGALLIAYGLLGALWPFAPMHLRETLAAGGETISDTLHLALAAITEIIYLAALGFAAAALGKKFRYYSIATVVLLALFGFLTFLDAPKLSLNEPTPFIGVWERINIGLFLLWIIVLAMTLLESLDKMYKMRDIQVSSDIRPSNL